jgi:hypothetical protein
MAASRMRKNGHLHSTNPISEKSSNVRELRSNPNPEKSILVPFGESFKEQPSKRN